MADSANSIVVGRPDVTTTTPSHTTGTNQGNAPGSYAKQRGHLDTGHSTAARSTGINAQARDPIDPRMPNLSPA